MKKRPTLPKKNQSAPEQGNSISKQFPRARRPRKVLKPSQALMLSMLRKKKQSTLDFRRVGIMHPGDVIFRLRNKGYVIHSHEQNLLDDAGVLHEGVAVYSLISEPIKVTS